MKQAEIEQLAAYARDAGGDYRRRANRLLARRGLGVGQTLYVGRLRKTHKTGQPAWFKEMQQEAAAQKIARPYLKSASPRQIGLAAGLSSPQSDRLNAAFATGWELSRASREDLLAIDGIGPKMVDRLKTYLASKQVNVKW